MDERKPGQLSRWEIERRLALQRRINQQMQKQPALSQYVPNQGEQERMQMARDQYLQQKNAPLNRAASSRVAANMMERIVDPMLALEAGVGAGQMIKKGLRGLNKVTGNILSKPEIVSRGPQNPTGIRMYDKGYQAPATGELAPYLTERPVDSKAQKVWESFFKDRSTAGPLPMKALGGLGDPTKPNMQDSLNLYNNNNKVIDFYRKNGYKETKTNSSFTDYLHFVNNAKDKAAQAEHNDRKMFVVKDDKFISDYPYKLKDQYQQLDANRFYSRESLPDPANLDAPMQLIDKRISPRGTRSFSKAFPHQLEPKSKAFDISEVAYYDPILIKPVSMLTDEEKQIRYNRYKDKSGIANPTPPIPPYQHLNGQIISTPDQQFSTGMPPSQLQGQANLQPYREGNYSATSRTNNGAYDQDVKQFGNKTQFEDYLQALKGAGINPETVTRGYNSGQILTNQKFARGGEIGQRNPYTKRDLYNYLFPKEEETKIVQPTATDTEEILPELPEKSPLQTNEEDLAALMLLQGNPYENRPSQENRDAGVNPYAQQTKKDILSSIEGITDQGIWGDQSHQRRKSDHNTGDAWDAGVPSLATGESLVNKLQKEAKERNIKYIIFNGKIWNPSISDEWRAYDGPDKHIEHAHVSYNR